jgi:hypothetical protein
MQKIDSLPTGPGWNRKMISILGDMLDGEGQMLEEELELWTRDPVECIKDLMQNPAFNGSMAYAPERVYRDSRGTLRVYDEMWTGDWWWEVQVSYCFSSDRT